MAEGKISGEGGLFFKAHFNRSAQFVELDNLHGAFLYQSIDERIDSEFLDSIYFK